MHKKTSRIRLTAMIGISVFTLLMLTFVFPSEIAAQRDDGPPAHDFGGTWSLRQSNGFVVTMSLKQNSRGGHYGDGNS